MKTSELITKINNLADQKFGCIHSGHVNDVPEIFICGGDADGRYCNMWQVNLMRPTLAQLKQGEYSVQEIIDNVSFHRYEYESHFNTTGESLEEVLFTLYNKLKAAKMVKSPTTGRLMPECSLVDLGSKPTEAQIAARKRLVSKSKQTHTRTRMRKNTVSNIGE